jgi:hypothetical protein
MPESVTDRCTKAHEYLFLLAKSERYYFDAQAIAENAVCTNLPGRNMTDTRETYGLQNGGNGGLRALHNKLRDQCQNDPTRNKRSVWEIATQSFPEAHFATFPPALIEPCIKAGTSERGCCPNCGKPWLRDVERTAMVLDRSERTHSKGRTRSSGTMIEPPTSKTLGWSRGCYCAADAQSNFNTVSCTVLDPFGGSGTTGLVADRLKRNAILIELNPEYAAMAERRIKGDCPMFTECSA